MEFSCKELTAPYQIEPRHEKNSVEVIFRYVTWYYVEILFRLLIYPIFIRFQPSNKAIDANIFHLEKNN